MTGKQKLASAEKRMGKLLKKMKANEGNMQKAAKDNGLDYAGEKDPTSGKKKPTKKR